MTQEISEANKPIIPFPCGGSGQPACDPVDAALEAIGKHFSADTDRTEVREALAQLNWAAYLKGHSDARIGIAPIRNARERKQLTQT